MELMSAKWESIDVEIASCEGKLANLKNFAVFVEDTFKTDLEDVETQAMTLNAWLRRMSQQNEQMVAQVCSRTFLDLHSYRLQAGTEALL